MKKFMKNCAITALIMIFLGIATTAAAVIAKGPDMIATITRYSNEILNKLNIGVHLNLIPELGFDADIPILESNSQQTIDAAGITKLDIELGSCELQILPSEDQYFYAHMDGTGTCQVYSDAETLCVKASSAISGSAGPSGDTNGIHLNLNGSTGAVTLYVPKDYFFEQVKITVGAGEINGSSAFRAAELKIELAAGEINLSNVEAGNLDAEVGAGVLAFAGNILQSVNAECGMGELSLQLTGTKTDYNYDVEVAAGEVTIDNESFGGIAGERKINNNASKNVAVECAMGNIDISFAVN